MSGCNEIPAAETALQQKCPAPHCGRAEIQFIFQGDLLQ